jgi:hypothetical protein
MQILIYDIWYDIFVTCNWVATQWQLYSTHLHTNNTQNDTKTIHTTEINILIFNFEVFYMFQTRGLIFRKTDVYTRWHVRIYNILSITFVWNMFDSKKNTAGYDQKLILVIM